MVMQNLSSTRVEEMARVHWATLQYLGLVLAACGDARTSPPLTENASGLGASSGRYVVVNPVWACPEASDFHDRIDGLIKGDLSVRLPIQCWELAHNTIVMDPPGGRPTLEYRGFDIQQAALASGLPFWSDELNGDSLRPAPSQGPT
jgi:hypothetical protein